MSILVATTACLLWLAWMSMELLARWHADTILQFPLSLCMRSFVRVSEVSTAVIVIVLKRMMIWSCSDYSLSAGCRAPYQVVLTIRQQASTITTGSDKFFLVKTRARLLIGFAKNSGSRKNLILANNTDVCLLGNLFSTQEKSNSFLRWLQSLAAHLRNTRRRDSYHPWLVSNIVTTQFTREKGGCSRNKFL